MTRPDWVPEAVWEKAMADAASLRNAVLWQSNAANEIIALALLSAKNEGKREAAEIARTYRKGVPAGAGDGQTFIPSPLSADEISQAILSSLQKEPK